MKESFLQNIKQMNHFVGISMDCNPVNQTTFVGKIPKIPNPPQKLLCNTFELKEPKCSCWVFFFFNRFLAHHVILSIFC
jgi:hypothetical protein